MGQSYSLTTPYAGSAGIDVPELSNMIHEKSLGGGRFMKSIRARGYDGLVVVKVTVKPHTPMSLKSYGDKILHERDKLRDVPNVLGYERALETETNAYLIRQYLYSSLYDRIATRPFLEDIEKRWIAFQLLCGLRDCHAREIYHGDIKTENILVTSWNWIYLSDFSATYKPTKLPDNNPALYSYFFDTSDRRTCYIAPERFVAPGEEANDGDKVNWAMDVFSAGCVIAELFLETPIFNLSQMYRYRRGEYDPVISHLSRIPDQALREMLTSMLAVDPGKRYSAEQYLQFYKTKVFPEYFYNFLHQYMELITDPSSGRAPISGTTKNLGEADERIDRVFHDFDKISYFLGYRDVKRQSQPAPFSPRLGLGLFPVRLNIPNNEHYASAMAQPSADDGTLIFLSLIAASLRNTARTASKVRACDVLLAFSERLTDEAKLDRVLPYLMNLLNDEMDIVVIAALRSVTQLLAMVSVVTPVNAHVFPEYIMPRMQVFLAGASRQLVLGKERREPTALVRATYASCLGSLATTANRFLEMTAILRAEGSINTSHPELEAGIEADTAFDGAFDNAQQELVELFEVHAKALVEDTDPAVRRAFLNSVPELCLFFGSADSNDILLTHLNTYLNDQDWMLKCAFFDTVVGIATFLGSTTLEEFNLPLMVQALTDLEEHVLQAALHSLAELAKLGLLSKAKTWELVDVVGRFTMHPNMWIREAAAEYLSSATKHLSPAHTRCIVWPHVKPLLKGAIVPDFSELDLLDALQRPLPRTVFDQALVWAQKADKGMFWKAVQKQKQSTFNIGSTGVSIRPARDMQALTLSRVPKNEEDEQWLSRLRNYGMTHDDELKLLVLREFIWRLSKMKSRESISALEPLKDYERIVNLRTIVGVQMQTVMFDESNPPDEVTRQTDISTDSDKGPYTIADALLDASMTIDEPVGRRRRAVVNNHRTRLSSAGGTISPRTINHRNTWSPTQTQPSSPTETRASFDDPRRTSSVTRGRPSVRDDDASSQDRPYSARRAIRHQSSALDLLHRKDSNRSVPETGTTEAHVFGQVEGPFAQNSPQKIHIPASIDEGLEAGPLKKASHTYEGNDPNVRKMLDGMFVDNYSYDFAEFGPLVTPVVRRRSTKSAGQVTDEAWRPTGRLVASFAEHTGAINRVVPSPDHLFFITGGDDGTVKVWDTMRLERNVTHRARHTHRHAPGAKVVALCFIENTHCFVSCATDGSVHIVKVVTIQSGSSTKYIQMRLLREYQLPPDEYAVWCTHFKLELPSVLLLATNRSRILAIDLRTMSLLYALENPVHHGTPTCFVVDRRRHWLLLGTSHGVLDLWDLRFRLRLKGWGLPGKSPIHRLALHPSKGRGRWVCVAGGTGLPEITVWDIEKAQCREIYRTSAASTSTAAATSSASSKGIREYKVWDVDEDKPEGMLGRFATNIEPSSSSSSPNSNTSNSICALTVGNGALDDIGGTRDVRYGYMVTGGADKKLRFWDLNRVEMGTVFSGLLTEDAKPAFQTVNVPNVPNLAVVVERAPTRSGGAGGGRESDTTTTSTTTSRKGRGARNARATTTGADANGNTSGRQNGEGSAGGGGGIGGTGARKKEKPPRHTVISTEQEKLLRSHLDSILDVAVLELPYPSTVSVDRSGVIFVFQ